MKHVNKQVINTYEKIAPPLVPKLAIKINLKILNISFKSITFLRSNHYFTR